MFYVHISIFLVLDDPFNSSLVCMLIHTWSQNKKADRPLFHNIMSYSIMHSSKKNKYHKLRE